MHLSNFEARAHGLVHVSAWHHSSRYAQSFQDEAETANHAFFSFHSQGVTKTNRLQIVLGSRKILCVVHEEKIKSAAITCTFQTVVHVTAWHHMLIHGMAPHADACFIYFSFTLTSYSPRSLGRKIRL